MLTFATKPFSVPVVRPFDGSTKANDGPRETSCREAAAQKQLQIERSAILHLRSLWPSERDDRRQPSHPQLPFLPGLHARRRSWLTAAR